MTGIIGTIVGALVIGAVVGGLARLVLPGKQDISIAMTIVIGIGGAIVGGIVAGVLGVRETSGIDWIKLALQVGFAALGTSVFVNAMKTRTPG